MRFLGDAIPARFGDFQPMVASICVSMTGFVLLGFSSNFALSVAAFARVGFGVAVLIPCMFATAASLAPGNRAGALGFAALLSAPPRILAPAVFGWVAGSFGTSFAFGLIAVALAVALALVVALMRGRGVEQVA